MGNRSKENLQPFRFMDLAYDARHLIYEELLTMNEQHKCQVQLLATSKQIHDEAEKIFYSCNTFKIEIGLRSIFLCGIEVVNYRSWEGSNDYDIKWPAFLRRLRHLKLCFRFEYDTTENGFIWALYLTAGENTELMFYSLCDFLGIDHHLRTLTLDLQLSSKFRNDFKETWEEYQTRVDFYSIRLIQKQDFCFTAIDVLDPVSRDLFSPGMLTTTSIQTPDSVRRRVFNAFRKVQGKVDTIIRQESVFNDRTLLGPAADVFGTETLRQKGKKPYFATIRDHHDIDLKSVTKLVPCLRYLAPCFETGAYEWFLHTFPSYGLEPAVYELLRAIVDLQIALRE